MGEGLNQQPIEVPVRGGVLSGHRGGEGPPALVLHGGPAMVDYTEGLARELGGTFSTIRYTQRGLLPSVTDGPFTVSSHLEDAVAVLDHYAIERAWAIGHSWGGYLALHLAIAYESRLRGLILIAAPGVDGGFLEGGLTEKQRAAIAHIDELERRGEATDEDRDLRLALLGPLREANLSINDHWCRRTLHEGLPRVQLPALFIHGADDPYIPLETVHSTVELIPGARLETIPNCGHFPWEDQPGQIEQAVSSFLA